MIIVASTMMLAGCGGGGAETGSSNNVAPVIPNTNGDIKFDPENVVIQNKNIPISQGVGYIKNQKWITSKKLTKEELTKIVSTYKDLKIIAYSQLRDGLLVEYDESNINIDSIFLSISQDKRIDGIYYQSYTGDNVKAGFFYPNDGSLFNNGGDN